ncbi:unnamed protein product [Peronospora effusa]|nr:unnamed protein product [Peronospora effusa]
MDVITLSEAVAHVGQNVRFIAAVQQISTGKRVLIARQRVLPCHVLHVCDASRQFFKITCWGDAPPELIHSSFTSEPEQNVGLMQMSRTDAVLQAGDIVLFSFCRIQIYRGNVEAQFIVRNNDAATSSTVQLLYRKDRYFSAQDVPLRDLYPMIEWFKQYRRKFSAEDERTTSAAVKKTKDRSTVQDLRENMVVSVLCKLRPKKNKSAAAPGGGTGVCSELDGVLLCELVMFDYAGDGMSLYLCDQHAEKRFVAKLLEHRGAVEIDGIVVSLHALSNRLLANTTPHTTFRLLDPDGPDSIDLENKIARSRIVFQGSTTFTAPTGPTSFSTLEELTGSLFEGLATLKNVRIEQVCLGRHFGHAATVLARFASHLAERYCTGCNQALPESPCQDRKAQSHFGACANRCMTRRSSADNALCAWRYRCFSILLRDPWNQRLQVRADNQATLEIVGNIEARVLIEAQHNASLNSQFDAASAVASLLNALVEDANQKFEAKLVCSVVRIGDNASQVISNCQDSSLGDESMFQRVFSLVSLVPCDAFSI